MFNKTDIELGWALVKDKLIPQLEWIQWKVESIDDLISYLVHHRFLNMIDTRRALIYLCTKKYKLDDSIEFMTRPGTDDSIFMPLLQNIMIDYIDTRDYKLLQYIYDEDYGSLYAYIFYLYFRNTKKSSVWRRSIMVWDVEFYKIMILNMLVRLPSEMLHDVAHTIAPDPKFLSQLKLYDNNSKAFKYYDHKMELLRNIHRNY